MILNNKPFFNVKKGIIGLFIGLMVLASAFSESGESSSENQMSRAEAQVAREKFVAQVNKQIDKPYENGSAGPGSFDSAGLICYGAAAVGKSLPKNVKAIYNDAKIIPNNRKEMGDIVFFKSKGGSISIAGVFLGGDSFIAAISSADGGEDCVSVFSLADEEWRSKYMAVGQFLPSGSEQPVKNDDEDLEAKADTKSKSDAKSKSGTKTEAKSKNTKAKTESKSKDKEKAKPAKKSGGFSSDDLVFDFTAYFDWSLLSPRQFVFRFRGIDALLGVNYAGWTLEPGLGVAFRYNYGLDTLQIPVTFSIKLNDYIKLYAGPVFTLNDVILIDTDKKIKGSIFPGIAGISFITPPLSVGGFEIKGVQDVSYTVYNNLDGATLSFMESLAAGFVMYTGVRVSFPLSIFGI